MLLAANAPCVIVIARKLEEAQLPSAWVQALEQGTAAMVGIDFKRRRLIGELAARRNDWIVHRCERIVVAHTSEAGQLGRQVLQWQMSGRSIQPLTVGG